MEKERKRSEKARNKKDEGGGGGDMDYNDEYDGMLCLNEREWERYRESDVWDIPAPSGRGKKSCMSREEWMELHGSYGY